ncbi:MULTISPECIES: LuxR family transcriptional regulator [unclassified Kitasatospora]|uniref:helix-turn-helix transcriptional regulator n=1 Tax=unclassified Kitasatospora TaxID=2633591 RepID=UPI002474B807|nr:AAA family ATPase [Kitasatospora sp. GAS204B]
MIGRDGELLAAREALRTAGAVLLSGPGGIGRTAVAAALAAEAADCGSTVLRCTPVPPERDLPYVGLGDLLAGLPGGQLDALLDGLPAGPARAALDAALLRGAGPGGATDRLALGLGLVDLLRALAARADRSGLLLVLDGLQWLDAPTTRALGFALRRAGTGVRVLATARDDAAPAGWWELCPPSTVEVRLPPLTPTAVAQLLARDLGGPLPVALLRDVQSVAAGNPGHALELARSGFRLGLLGPHGVPPALRAAMLARLCPYGAAERRLLLLAAVAARPTLALLREAAGCEPIRLLDGALRARVLELVDPPRPAAPPVGAGGPEAGPRAGELRFREPVLRVVLLAEAGPTELAAARSALAAATADPEERARLAALAQLAPPDARTLAEAARRAHRRGAPEEAYGLALLAIRQGAHDADRLTGPVDLAEPAVLVDAAGYAAAAARWPEARALALRVLAPRAPGDVGRSPAAVVLRTRARVVLLRSAGQAPAGLGELIGEGLAEVGTVRSAQEPAGAVGWAESELLRWAADGRLLAGDPGPAATAAEAAVAAAVPGEAAQRVAALGTLAAVRAARGELRSGRRALAEAAALLRGVADRGARSGLRLGLLRAELALDDPAALRTALAIAVPGHPDVSGSDASGSDAHDADAHGFDAPDLAAITALGLRCAAHARLGDAASAMAAADQLREALATLGEPLAAPASAPSPAPASAPSPVHGLALHAAALAELTGGSAERAGELARRAAAGWAAAGDRLHQVRALGTLGESGLLRGDAAATAVGVEVLQEARRLSTAAGFADPAAVRRLALLAEGLAALGEHGTAAQVLRQGHDLTLRWEGGPQLPARAALDRAAGLAQAGVGNGRAAVDLLRAAAERQRAAGLPLEVARTLLALGSVERRLRHRPGARAVLLEARELCADRTAHPLLARVMRELGRLDQVAALPGADGGLLTASEQRMAGLAADGATNREVAAALFVSVKTVEGTLSRVYRKLGVRSRAGLARALAAGG